MDLFHEIDEVVDALVETREEHCTSPDGKDHLHTYVVFNYLISPSKKVPILESEQPSLQVCEASVEKIKFALKISLTLLAVTAMKGAPSANDGPDGQHTCQ